MDAPALKSKLAKLYGDEAAAKLTTDIHSLVKQAGSSSAKFEISERDAALITYANSIADGQSPTLRTLKEFLAAHQLDRVFPIVHLLPFFPWDQDRGFSVMDYYKVQEGYGDWSDVNALAQDVKLMFDFVANHASIENPLLQAALIDRHIADDHPLKKDTAAYAGFVIAFSDGDKPSDEELAALARPRATPVLSPYVVYEREGVLKAELGASGGFGEVVELGSGWVWTTFSRPKADDGSEETRQVDLNFKCPGVLLEVVKILLFYRKQGASLIRLDAIGYLWKKLGSSSLHEQETHVILDILHDVMQAAAPDVITVAEVNEPQDKVFTYLGSGDSVEADWVYQFTHFPLALHAVFKESAVHYREWLPTTGEASGRQFITSLGTHDGVGMKPVRGILSEEEIDALCAALIDQRGGLANYAILPGGAKIVYEVCGTPWSLINGGSTEAFELKLRRYLTILGLSFVVRGLPAVYINGVVGASNYVPAAGLDENRTMNREVFDYEVLTCAAKNSESTTNQVLRGVSELFAYRAAEPAFTPNLPPAEVVDCGNDALLAVRLQRPSGGPLIVAANVSSQRQQLDLGAEKGDSFTDSLSGYAVPKGAKASLAPYQTCWFSAD